MKMRQMLYGATITLGAFLLFSVEPMAAKQLLPVLGGVSAVWLTCLFFFQAMLLLAYGYVYWVLRGRARGRRASGAADFGAVLSLLLPGMRPRRARCVSGDSDLSDVADFDWGAVFSAGDYGSIASGMVCGERRAGVPYGFYALSNLVRCWR